jgi:hypothetical protein
MYPWPAAQWEKGLFMRKVLTDKTGIAQIALSPNAIPLAPHSPSSRPARRLMTPAIPFERWNRYVQSRLKQFALR